MIRVTQHTARKDGRPCALCSGTVHAGEGYRQLVAVGESDAFGSAYVRWIAHEFCAMVAEGWAVRNDDAVGTDPACAYVRSAYKLDIVRGSSVVVNGRPGVVRGATNHVYVAHPGERRLFIYHPSEVKTVDPAGLTANDIEVLRG